MPREGLISALARCFSKLPKKGRDLLAYHVKIKTPVMCGPDAFIYTDGKGGA